MQHVKAPEAVTSDETESKLETQIEQFRAKYLSRRSMLENVVGRLAKLRKTLSALQHQIDNTQDAWKKDFVQGLGEQSKGVRDQLKQKGQWKIEAEHTQEMIDLLEPQREWLQMQTYMARNPLEASIERLARISSRKRLMKCLKDMSNSEEMAALSAELPRLFNDIHEGTYNDHYHMAGLGIDVSSQPGSSIDSLMDKDSRRWTRKEIERRQYAALGKLLMDVMPQAKPAPTPEVLQIPALLACEADVRDYPSQIGFKRRLQELEAQMEYVPSQEDLDRA
ncbi:hypothetical protein NH398_00615 [Halomonas sp. CnH100-B]|uniref:hypothetical protein n=1 Tax=Halomonas sp. CnH100-B TaxID=2954490 RepID=UPI00209716AF|nr:hypothetical protein [Halomonas sp. CnH100-B]MCO7227737.1 hypothetical protein [Halomonas sp. CnH100-B]